MKATELYKGLQINLPEYGFKFDKYGMYNTESGIYNTVNSGDLQIDVFSNRNLVTVIVSNGFYYLKDTTDYNKGYKPNMVALTGDKIEEFASQLN